MISLPSSTTMFHLAASSLAALARPAATCCLRRAAAAQLPRRAAPSFWTRVLPSAPPCRDLHVESRRPSPIPLPWCVASSAGPSTHADPQAVHVSAVDDSQLATRDDGAEPPAIFSDARSPNHQPPSLSHLALSRTSTTTLLYSSDPDPDDPNSDTARRAPQRRDRDLNMGRCTWTLTQELETYWEWFYTTRPFMHPRCDSTTRTQAQHSARAHAIPSRRAHFSLRAAHLVRRPALGPDQRAAEQGRAIRHPRVRIRAE
ncbi:hypothetical protein AMAG_03280 [Allomyces macrogynus ATCC 38327]|uniref:Uncharacterized protein n=1 Tax=Allomyces macrogynus (strain ATCC 38327) TaxID=578462 RepID=A0A0L0S559_ALLM3|nr:hypothetical protein AMAG_03280 [Allomyces macrogynus ATCC 38327]|eukprot:KNE57590.1 hypothetical protein AMAG_03280 [Allomyces macrogynus ATCC 38327]